MHKKYGKYVSNMYDISFRIKYYLRYNKVGILQKISRIFKSPIISRVHPLDNPLQIP